MKVLLLSEIFPPKVGGSGRWFWEIYRRLPRENVVVAAGEDPRAAEFDQTHDLKIARIPLSWTEWGLTSTGGLRNYYQAVRRLIPLLRQRQIDRVHCGRLLPEGWVSWLLKRFYGVPYLCYVHGEELFIASRQFRWMMRRILRGAELVIANSQNTATLLQRDWQLPCEKVQVLNPGVDVDRFVPTESEEQGREKLGWSGRRVVLTVGRLQERKGQDMLIRAVSKLRSRMPDILYSIVGDGDRRDYLEQLVAQLGVEEHVELRGEPDDRELIECYQQCDLFALPNRDVDGDIEGFGMVLLEAQACGKPVVAGDSGGTAETMQVPHTGRIVDCRTPESLRDMVGDLLSDDSLRESMGAAARGWTLQRFSWESLSREAAGLFGMELSDYSNARENVVARESI